jgi:amino acid permease
MGLLKFGKNSSSSFVAEVPTEKPGATVTAVTAFSASSSSSTNENGPPITLDTSGDILDDGLRRGLKSRHFVLISLGSIIGPGCFWGIGYALHLSGPLGALLGFSIVGVAVWSLMQSLGEVTTLFPIHGGFIEHMGRFVDPALSFAVAWLYYLMWSVFLASGQFLPSIPEPAWLSDMCADARSQTGTLPSSFSATGSLTPPCHRGHGV